MRYTTPVHRLPPGTYTITKFLFKPVSIGIETRWLEKATIEIERRSYYCENPKTILIRFIDHDTTI